MCKESIAVAICAPNAPPTLTFTCGRLHLIADSRQICDEALGSCVCFFGSCGKIEKITRTEAFELGDITKARCVVCTAREDQVGERRHGSELAESPLLVRSAIQSPVALAHFEMDVKILWNHAKECPFHSGGGVVSHPANSANSASPESLEKSSDCASYQHEGSIGSQSPNEGAPLPTASLEQDQTPPESSLETLPEKGDMLGEVVVASDEPDRGLTLNIGLVTSRWARSPTSAAPFADQDRHPAKNNGNKGDMENGHEEKEQVTINEDGNVDRKQAQQPVQLLDGKKVSFLVSAKKFLERS